MLIDSYYFTRGQRRISSLTLGDFADPRQREIHEFVNECIESLVPVYLTDTFGLEHGRMLLRQIEHPELQEDTTAIDALCRRLKEPCADFVFFHILAQAQNEATIDGLIRHKLTDPHVSPIVKQVPVWNDMVRKHHIVKEWLKTQPELKGIEIAKDMMKPINRFNL